MYGYWFAVTSEPRARTASIFLIHIFNLAEIILAAHFDVINMHRNAGLFGNANRLVQLFIDLFAFAAHMGAVVATVFCDDLWPSRSSHRRIYSRRQ